MASDDVNLPPLPASPKKAVAEPYKRKPAFNADNLSGGAWPTESEYREPTAEYLSRATTGPLGSRDEVRQQVQSRFDREYGAGSSELNRVTKQATDKMRKRVNKKFSPTAERSVAKGR